MQCYSLKKIAFCMFPSVMRKKKAEIRVVKIPNTPKTRTAEAIKQF